MQVDLEDLLKRAGELAADEKIEEAWRIVEPLASYTSSNQKLAYLWTALASASALDDSIAATATEIISAHAGERSLVALAAALLAQVAETRPFDEAPLPNGPARIAADALTSVIGRLSSDEKSDPDVVVDLYSELAMALRMTGSQDDDAALEAMQDALRLDPEHDSSWLKLGLLHKWRGRWREGIDANQRARALGSTGEAVLWNLAICATGAGDHALAASVMQELGMKGQLGSNGMFEGGFDPVQVRVSTLGEGIDPAAHVIGAEPDFEYLWIERRSLVHGKIANASVYDLPVDYGDVVLFDGAPVGYRDDGNTRVPRFPLLQKLRAGAYKRYRFRARQPQRGFLRALDAQLPDEVFFYPHDEQVNMLCRECATAGKAAHDHTHPESFIVSGKFVTPEALLDLELAARLDAAIGDQALVAIPELFRDLGDARRAFEHDRLWDELGKALTPDEPEVACALHGPTSATYLCQHLVDGHDLGFITAYGSDTDRPDAWCLECERVRMVEGDEWNDRSAAFAGVRVACTVCYDAARERNEHTTPR